MRQAAIYNHGILAGVLTETDHKQYEFHYNETYAAAPISLTMRINQTPFIFDTFPPFFDGLLPEGPQLAALLKEGKIDRDDFLGQLMAVGHDLVGSITVGEAS